MRTDAQWKARLSPASYAVLRTRGTEAPDSSPLRHVHGAGAYRCAACGLPIFDTADQDRAEASWPTFGKPVAPAAVWYRLDRTGGLHEVEVLCARCDGHLGHVFDDGPKSRGGLRYCIDGAALTFSPR